MSLIIPVNGTDLDLLTITTSKLEELNTFDEDVLVELAHKIISEFTSQQIEQLVEYLAKVCIAQKSFQDIGFRGFLGHIMSAYVDKHDGERAFIELFKAKDNSIFTSTFEFSEHSRKLFTCLRTVAEESSKTSTEASYLASLASNLYESVLEPIVKTRGAGARSPSMFYVSYTLNQLRANKTQLEILFNRSIIQEPVPVPKETAVMHPLQIRQKTAEIAQLVEELTCNPEVNQTQLIDAVASTEQVLTGKLSIEVYTREAQALTNSNLKDLGLLMLSLATSLLLLAAGVVATGGSNLIAGTLVLGGLCAADYGYSFFQRRVFPDATTETDAETMDQSEMVPSPVNNP